MSIPDTMTAVQLTGHGGFEKLAYRTDVPVPEPNPDEVLIRVGAAGVNNTDINTRIGWYSSQVTEDTGVGAARGFHSVQEEDASWSGISLTFPRIQGADICGTIQAVGSRVSSNRIGERVIVRNMLRSYVNWRPYECWTIGSECDGGFAQYVKAPALESHRIQSSLTDTELASFPCAYSTAENMIYRAGIASGERVLVTGASGGVGSAAVQLLKRRGAKTVAVAGSAKASSMQGLGADRVVDRDENLISALEGDSFDGVIDLVAGKTWPQLIALLKRGGRYAAAGAIAGPIVEFDIRRLYLKDLTFFGCTFQEDVVFENLITYIEKKEIKPIVAKTYPLKDIVQAQKDFLEKKFTGKLVLIPPKT